ncbi:MAG: hypothetical protein BWX92_01846 [Deltaproteobacteria bacterium ADurb.Bin135]|nr:MAG: hypothetical protein BWX92_01846 [Deltaproteobacteria bacterium ADurb.Bin135]
MQTYGRDAILRRFEEDLVGPFDEEEVLESRPSDVYLTGILWPNKTRMGAENDEKLGAAGGSGSDADTGAGTAEEEEVAASSLNRPCSAGLSFAAASTELPHRLKVTVSFATYEPFENSENGSPGKSAEYSPRIRQLWKRHPFKIVLPDIILPDSPLPSSIDLSEHGAPVGIRLHLRGASWLDKRLVTITLINGSEPDDSWDRTELERHVLFQVRIEVNPAGKTSLVARPPRRTILDEDDLTADLLYRGAVEFSVGHTCSAEWTQITGVSVASMVATSWIPKVVVPGVSAAGAIVFEKLRKDKKRTPLSAEWLSGADSDDLERALNELPDTYRSWIDTQEEKLAALSDDHREQALKNLMYCREIADRMTEGASRISRDPLMGEAFRLANMAMLIQYRWDPEKSARGPLEWRPFQLGFILMAAASVADRGHPDRNIMDLLWFPTGGGKTEAYLALIAFLAFYRRIASKGSPDRGSGVAAVMRYTLRLLTTQQFVRASAMILACEVIRRNKLAGKKFGDLGNRPFSVGLWVGGEATPNKFKDALASLQGSQDVPSPKQLADCPACRKPLTWYAEQSASAIRVKCTNNECVLFDSVQPLPVYTVDEDVYREQPTLVIGTIDKFSQIVRRPQINDLFAVKGGLPPDLIIQDELHLISGPLGTIAGLYEVAIDRLFAQEGKRPKIIGSTATIRKAREQVRALFNRMVCQFPPPGIDATDSCFATVDRFSPGRMYAGVTTAGRSAKFTLQAVAASVLQSALACLPDNANRDPYWTLVLYFNSLRELGGAVVLMQDDVNDSLNAIASRRGEARREPKMIEELTSRRTQTEVRDMLDRLATKAGEDGALDAVLATNMMSVGVDIPRLGIMLVNGQPKGIAEYIQSTSRVGRGDVPGLVISLLNNAKARDRSHYEAFSTWHETLYRDVEATSVTPFASRARDRGLHAVIVSLIRHLVDGMLNSPKLEKGSPVSIGEMVDEVVSRAASIDPQEKSVAAELEALLDEWSRRDPDHYWNRFKPNRSLLQDAERVATLRALGRSSGEAWSTMNNMRSVEPSTRFRLVDRPRQTDSGGTDG